MAVNSFLAAHISAAVATRKRESATTIVLDVFEFSLTNKAVKKQFSINFKMNFVFSVFTNQ